MFKKNKEQFKPLPQLPIGETAPDFRANSTEGPIHLYDYKGKKNVILIFYPINNTGGCRKQLCAARDALADYAALDAVVFGINPGKFEGHQKFAQKNNFGFPLIYDENWKIAYDYKIITLMGIMQARTVYIIDKNMKVRHTYKGDLSVATTKEILEEINNER
jgi:peroxiredoxin Q/BCP